MGKLYAIFDVFRKGSSLANPAPWKTGQVAANVAAFISACAVLAKYFGIEVPLTDEQAIAIGSGVAAVAAITNGMLTVATTDKIGLPTVDKSGGAGGDQPAGNGEHETRIYP
jgi:hypothetical protein